MALAFVEAGARAVYCVDLSKTGGEEWTKVQEYVKATLGGKTGGEGRLEYVGADVRDQVRGLRWRFQRIEGGSAELRLRCGTYTGRDVEDWEDDWGSGGEDGRVRRRGGHPSQGRPLLDVLREAFPTGKLAPHPPVECKSR